MANDETPKGIMEDPAKRAIIDERAAQFRAEMDGWRLTKSHMSPPLSEGLKDLLVQGYYELLEGIDKAERMEKYRVLTRTTPALLTENKILEMPEIRDKPKGKAIANGLLGSMIRRALDTAKAVGIEHELVHVEPEHFFTHGSKEWGRF